MHFTKGRRLMRVCTACTEVHYTIHQDSGEHTSCKATNLAATLSNTLSPMAQHRILGARASLQMIQENSVTSDVGHWIIHCSSRYQLGHDEIEHHDQYIYSLYCVYIQHIPGVLPAGFEITFLPSKPSVTRTCVLPCIAVD
mgnify:CR=1 FL=1